MSGEQVSRDNPYPIHMGKERNTRLRALVEKNDWKMAGTIRRYIDLGMWLDNRLQSEEGFYLSDPLEIVRRAVELWQVLKEIQNDPNQELHVVRLGDDGQVVEDVSLVIPSLIELKGYQR